MYNELLELIEPENLLLYIFAYGLLSMPTSIVVARIMRRNVDIKNPKGNTHTRSHIFQKSNCSGVLVFSLDVLMGLIPCAIGHSLDEGILALCAIGFFSVLGHCFSVWLKFSGGHGSTTLAGSLLMVYWPASIAIFFMNFILFILKFNVGQASMIAAITGATVVFFSVPNKMACLIVVLSVGIIILRHKKTSLV